MYSHRKSVLPDNFFVDTLKSETKLSYLDRDDNVIAIAFLALFYLASTITNFRSDITLPCSLTAVLFSVVVYRAKTF